MKQYFLLALLLVGCTEDPFIPEEPPTEVPVEEQLNNLLNVTPVDTTLMIRVSSFINGTSYEDSITQYLSVKGVRTSTEQIIDGRKVGFDDFMIEEGVFSCVKDGGWSCYAVPEPEVIDEAPPKPTISKASSRVVAGLRAECFLLEYSFFTEELCVSEGLILYKKNSFGDDYIEETVMSVQRFVANSVFELPGEVVE